MDQQTNKKSFKHFWQVTALVLSVVGLLSAIGATFWLVREYQQVALRYGLDSFNYQSSNKGAIYSSDGVVIAELSNKNKDHVPLEKISEPMKKSIIAIEDHRFYDHFGVDVIGTLRALFKDIVHGEAMEGGSTITQQLVRNLFLTQDKTFSRKITEILLAVNLERRFTKDEILEMYLNEIYFGNGCYGVEAAAQKYFGKHAADLDLAEATMLAGIPKSPNNFEPLHHPLENKSRQQDTLSRMLELKLINPEQAREAIQEQVKVHNFTNKTAQNNHYKFPYFTTEVINQLVEMYGKERVFNGGLKVTTTLDSRAAQAAEDVARQKVAEFRRRGIRASNMAIVSVSPRDGAIIALVGGVDFTKDQNNLALLPRQPGSAIKPINYAGALDKGIINENTVLNASSKKFGNYYVSSHTVGSVTVSTALKYSMNVPAVEVVQSLGINNTIKNLKRFGISTVTDSDANLAIALGGMYYGIKPLEMAAAYATFANSGKYYKPYMIKSVEDSMGNVLYQHDSQPDQVISSRTAQIMTKMLQEVVRGGTGVRANISGNEAGKTGTTDDSRCLWFVGYNQEISTAVWIGNSNNRPVSGYSGGDLAAPVWREYMLTLMERHVITEPEKKYVPVVTTGPPLDEDVQKNQVKTDEQPNQNVPSDGNPQTPDNAAGDNSKANPDEPGSQPVESPPATPLPPDNSNPGNSNINQGNTNPNTSPNPANQQPVP